MTTARTATALLAEAGVPNPAHDARALIRHAEGACLDADVLIAERARRVPLQHLLGSAGFRYLDLAVGPGVFIPRPETELLVDAVLDAIRPLDSAVVVDLCAGSGAIGLSVAHEAGAQVHLVENSPEAFAWLRRNAEGRDHVHLHLCDLTVAPVGFDAAVDVVVSNPPYVPDSDRWRVEPEVRDHDPAQALWAGPDGLDVIRAVVPRASTLLRPGGTLVVEHADEQGQSVPELFRRAGFVRVTDHPDLAGRPRYTTGRQPW